jgi:hypothetical protein
VPRSVSSGWIPAAQQSHHAACGLCSNFRESEQHFLRFVSPWRHIDDLVHILHVDIRLMGAREKMLVEGVDATKAVFDVGYTNASSVNRRCALKLQLQNGTMKHAVDRKKSVVEESAVA